MNRTYFLVNDTRYHNHHGCLTVVRNLHLGMQRRGWNCVGSLPVSASVRQLGRYRRQLREAQLVVVNGEGTLHHDRRGARRLLEVCEALQATHPVVLLNALWQDNDATRWQPVLDRFKAVAARDQRSQAQLRALGVDAHYAPDLTFYDYPKAAVTHRSKFGCTDSVLNDWTMTALQQCAQDDDMRFCPVYTGELRYRRGPRDWDRRVKYRLYPWLGKRFGLNIPPRYRSLPYAERATEAFLEKLASCEAVCVARYHVLCFAVQQQIPFVAVASNSHKSEALVEELGLPLDRYVMAPTDFTEIKVRLARAVDDYPRHAKAIADFNQCAREQIDTVFDLITEGV